MRPELFGRNRALFPALSASLLAALVQCTAPPAIVVPGFDAGETAKAPPEHWTRFGAYYVYDDLMLSMEYNEELGTSKASYTVVSRLRILNPGGAKYGTIPVPRYTENLARFEVDHRDSLGHSVPLDLRDLRSKYRESGKIVVPQVTPGSEITVRLVFEQEHAPPFFEHWFARVIPVQSGRFVVDYSRDSRLRYDAVVYGTREVPGEEALDQAGPKTKCWAVENLDPIDSTPFRQQNSVVEPRVSIVAAPLCDLYHVEIRDWKGLSPLIKYTWVDRMRAESEYAIKAKADQITAGIEGDRNRAAAIAEWVQCNVMCRMSPSSLPLTTVLSTGQADMLQAGVLCRDLMAAARLKAELLLTRAQSRGGFDPRFVSPADCREGLVLVRFGKSLCPVTPIYVGYPIGSYPPDYAGLCGLNIDRSDTVTLPPSEWKELREHSRVVLRPGKDSSEAILQASYEEQFAGALRQPLHRLGMEKQREWVTQLINTFGAGNVLDWTQISGVEGTGPALRVDARFWNTTQPIDVAGVKRFNAGAYFHHLFGEIDSSRHSEVCIVSPLHYTDTLEIDKQTTGSTTVDAVPGQINGVLFDARISVEEKDRCIYVIRDVSVHSGTIPADNIGALVGDIRNLDRMSKPIVAVIFKNLQPPLLRLDLSRPYLPEFVDHLHAGRCRRSWIGIRLCDGRRVLEARWYI